MNAFAEYGKKATTVAVPRLVGVIRTRAEARLRYNQIIAELAACKTIGDVDDYLSGIAHEIVQYAAELEFLWTGDDDFRGLEREIEWARARVDDGADFPRWEPRTHSTEQ